MIVYGSHQRKKYTVGGKANGLYQLLRAGLRVPDFLVIPAETFDAVLRKFPADEQALALRKEKLLAFALSEKDEKEITRMLASWHFPGQPVVVRSSVADEDGKKDAFPGMMDSFLNVTSLEGLTDAIARCAASAYSERAMAYRQQKGLTLAARPAVIVQQQVDSTSSGVLFTTFPEYPQEMAIHATFGFGQGLVGGQLEADEFYLWKQSGKLNRQKIAHKEVQWLAREDKGIQPVPLAPERQSLPSLAPTQLEKLFAMGSQVERFLSHPQDIEFVLSGEEILLVQSRPITQPIPEIIVYDNSNIQESYCGVTTPLTFSFARRAYATVYRQTMAALGLPPRVIRAQEGVVTGLLGLVKGRIYYHINNWYRGLQLLPSFRQNKADMERMMGLEEPVDFVEDRQKTAWQKFRLLPGLLANIVRLLLHFRLLNKRVPAFHTRFAQYYRHFYEQPLTTMREEALLDQKNILDQALLQHWTTPIINDFYVMMTNGQATAKLRKSGLASPEDFLSRYLSGDKQLASAQPTRVMQKLAAQAQQQPMLRQLILPLPANLHERVKSQFPDFYGEVQHFIEKYGDRTIGELKLETCTMRMEPIIFYKYMRNYLVAEADLPAETESSTRLHQEAVAELTRLLKDRPAFFRRKVWNSLGRLQQAIRYRESLRLERTRLFGMYRALYLTLGERLTEKGSISAASEVFYLTEEEIIQATTQTGTADWASLVSERQREFAQYAREEVPSRVIIPFPPATFPSLVLQRPDVLLGTGCFQGEVTGEVIVVTDPGSDLEVRGKIVCALRTDPGWAALFPTCLGVLIEKGSSLSHSVIVLRELAIPTIINVPGLTKRLQTGQRVRMNGSTGEINLCYDEDH